MGVIRGNSIEVAEEARERAPPCIGWPQEGIQVILPNVDRQVRTVAPEDFVPALRALDPTPVRELETTVGPEARRLLVNMKHRLTAKDYRSTCCIDEHGHGRGNRHMTGETPRLQAQLHLEISSRRATRYILAGRLEFVGRAVHGLDVDVAPRATLDALCGGGSGDESDYGKYGECNSVSHHAFTLQQEACPDLFPAEKAAR
jgi:hypothetical protein